MSLNPWLPVPMTPTVMRLLGATLPERPSAGPGSSVGNAKPDRARPAALANEITARRLAKSWFHGLSSQERGAGATSQW